MEQNVIGEDLRDRLARAPGGLHEHPIAGENLDSGGQVEGRLDNAVHPDRANNPLQAGVTSHTRDIETAFQNRFEERASGREIIYNRLVFWLFDIPEGAL